MEDIIMLKNFVRWFIIFGLSFLVANVSGQVSQGQAFLYLNLGIGIFFILVLIVLLLIAGLISGATGEATGVSLLVVLITIGAVFLNLFLAWAVAKLFHLDFYLAYEIFTFVSCLIPNNKKDQ